MMAIELCAPTCAAIIKSFYESETSGDPEGVAINYAQANMLYFLKRETDPSLDDRKRTSAKNSTSKWLDAILNTVLERPQWLPMKECLLADAICLSNDWKPKSAKRIVKLLMQLPGPNPEVHEVITS